MYEMEFQLYRLFICYISFEIPLSPMRFLTIEKWRWIPQLPLECRPTRFSQGTSENLGSFTGSWLLKSTWQERSGHGLSDGLSDYVGLGMAADAGDAAPLHVSLKNVDPYLAQSTKNEWSKLKTNENDDVVFAFKIWKQRMIKYPKWPLGWYHLIGGFPTQFSKLGSASL